jgi:tetratricopeptide (TPR) repeat protein
MDSSTTAATSSASPTPDASPAISASEIQRLRALIRQHRFAEALQAGEALLEQVPDQRDALLSVAVAQRYLGRPDEALGTLATLELHHPRFSRLYEEQGRCFVDRREAPQAAAAFLRAVNLNPALPGSWRMLEGLYRMSGRAADAAAAAAELAKLESLPSQVVTATALFEDGDLDTAEPMVRAFLLEQGDHVEAMRLLARIGVARGVLDDAEILLRAVLQLAPEYRVARREYARVLFDLHKYEEARTELDALLLDEPDDRPLETLYAACCAGLGEHERAIDIYRELLRETRGDADVHLLLAHAQKTIGQTDEAIDSYRHAFAGRPDFGDAYWSLANLKTYRFAEEEIAQMRAAESAQTTGYVDRYHLCFALGKALEDRADYSEAFRWYERGNALKRAESKYRAEIIENNTRRQIEVCTAEFFASRRGFGAPDSDPIFVVGLPRAGSTLLEQILASHSSVDGTQELPNIQQIVQKLRGREAVVDDPRYPRILEDLDAETARKLGEHYLERTRVYRAGKARFVDKMPNNFRHLGLIHLILPNARIIDARREPMACCFSNLKQLFGQGQEFTYSISDIARYYRTYLELMEHWDRVLDGRILRVYHEDVVDDLEGNVRRMLEFCGLDFEPQCVEFHKTRRSVRTASSEQVRRPLNREGLDQWKHFEPWLDPLKEALGDAPKRYRTA